MNQPQIKPYAPDELDDTMISPASKIRESMTGFCLCGNISVTIHDTNLLSEPRSHLCQCANCRQSGSFASSSKVVPKDKVTYEDKKKSLKTYEDRDTSTMGRIKRLFGGNCGSSIMSQPSTSSQMYVVKMGMFTSIAQPECENFATYQDMWQGRYDGPEQYVTNQYKPEPVAEYRKPEYQSTRSR